LRVTRGYHITPPVLCCSQIGRNFSAGTTTLAEFRRRGIAAALTAHMVATAFAHGVEVVCLSAAGEHAGWVYERVGFQPFATMLAYIAPEGE
jgi:predicted GNAT family acetyltransferase